MKNKLLIFLLLLSIGVQAQTTTNTPTRFITGVGVPITSTAPFASQGFFWWQPSSTLKLAVYNGTVWQNLLTETLAGTTYAPLASPAFTGIPTAPTATLGTNTTQLATTAFTSAGLALKQNLVTLTTIGSGPATFNQSTGSLNIPTAGSGTVTSVNRGIGFTSSGIPITTSGTLDIDTNVIRTTSNSRTLAQTQTALNLKQNVLSGTGFVKSTGGTISYDNSSYYLASNPNGYTSNTGTVTSFGKVDGYGVTSSVANPTTTPVHTVAVDTTTIMPKVNAFTKSQADVRYLKLSPFASAQTIDGQVTINNSLSAFGRLTGYGLQTLTSVISGATTLSTNQHTISCTGGSYTVTIPSGNTSPGQQYAIKNNGSGTITLAFTGGETLDGSSSYALGVGESVQIAGNYTAGWTKVGSLSMGSTYWSRSGTTLSPTNAGDQVATSAVPTIPQHLTNKAYVDSKFSQVVEITGTSQTGDVNTIYIPHNAALTTISLPVSSTIGALFQIVGEGAGGWKISQAAGQFITGVGATTTTGTGGSVASTNANCTITLRLTNTNKWTVTSSQGTLNFL